MEQFEVFCAKVCTYVNHATPKERTALGLELREHLEDRAEAYAAGGLAEEAAAERAVAAMGDAESLGRALNRQYPLGWLLLSRGALALCLVVVLLLVPTLSDRASVLGKNLASRYAPQLYLSQEERADGFDPGLTAKVLDTTVRLYWVRSSMDGENQLFYDLYFSFSSDNPFRYPSGQSLAGRMQISPTAGSGGAYFGAFDARIGTSVPVGTETVQVFYDQFGHKFGWELDLSGGETA